MANALKAARELVTSRRYPIPSTWLGQMLVLEFVKPVASELMSNFLRIGLCSEQLAGGEDRFHRVDVTQPKLAQPSICTFCNAMMRQDSESRWTCRNAKCERFARGVIAGPRRGVVQTLTFADMVYVDPETTREMAVAVALILDRRYHDNVLLTIRNAAGCLCDQMGWRLR